MKERLSEIEVSFEAEDTLRQFESLLITCYIEELEKTLSGEIASSDKESVQRTHEACVGSLIDCAKDFKNGCVDDENLDTLFCAFKDMMRNPFFGDAEYDAAVRAVLKFRVEYFYKIMKYLNATELHDFREVLRGFYGSRYEFQEHEMRSIELEDASIGFLMTRTDSRTVRGIFRGKKIAYRNLWKRLEEAIFD